MLHLELHLCDLLMFFRNLLFHNPIPTCERRKSLFHLYIKNRNLFHYLPEYQNTIKKFFRSDEAATYFFSFKFLQFVMTSPCNHGNHWLLRMSFYFYYRRLPPYQICLSYGLWQKKPPVQKSV